MADVERVRMDKFNWERLMLMSELPFPTRAVLMMLSPFMSEDGGGAHPGMENMVLITRRGKTMVGEHLSAGVAAGYLEQVERGGYRGGGRGRPGRRASVFVATVPKDVFDRAMEILNSPPWRKSTSGGPDLHLSESTSGKPDLQSFAMPSEGPVFGSEGPVFSESTSGGPDPINPVYINPEVINPAREPARDPSGARVAPSAKTPHAYVADPQQGGWCRCSLAEKNRIHTTKGVKR